MQFTPPAPALSLLTKLQVARARECEERIVGSLLSPPRQLPGLCTERRTCTSHPLAGASRLKVGATKGWRCDEWTRRRVTKPDCALARKQAF